MIGYIMSIILWVLEIAKLIFDTILTRTSNLKYLMGPGVSWVDSVSSESC